MRKKYKNISSLEGNDPWSIVEICMMTFSHLFISMWMGNYFVDNYWALFFIGWFFGGFWSNAAGLAIHEASHSLVFCGKWGSFIAGAIGEFPLFLPAYRSFKHYHLPHHSYITIDLHTKKEFKENKT